MALGAHYRFTIYNSTGVSIPAGNVVVKARRWKMTTAGKVLDGNPVTVFTSGAAIGNGTFFSSGNVDNTGANDRWETGDFELTVTLAAAGNGAVTVYYDASVDGATFPDHAAGCPVASVGFVSTGTLTRRLVFRL